MNITELLFMDGQSLNNKIIQRKVKIMKISKQYQFENICCLPVTMEKTIMAAVRKNISNLLLNKKEKQEAIENANCSKVCDLEHMIKIQYI